MKYFLLALVLASCASSEIPAQAQDDPQEQDFDQAVAEATEPPPVNAYVKPKHIQESKKLPFCRKLVEASSGVPLCKPKIGKHACFCLGNTLPKEDED